MKYGWRDRLGTAGKKILHAVLRSWDLIVLVIGTYP